MLLRTAALLEKMVAAGLELACEYAGNSRHLPGLLVLQARRMWGGGEEKHAFAHCMFESSSVHLSASYILVQYLLHNNCTDTALLDFVVHRQHRYH